MTKDFIDELVEVVELKKTVKQSSKERFLAKKANSFEIAGVEVVGKRQLSEETKKKLSEAHKGKNKPPLSDKTKMKMSEVRLGKKMPPRTEEHARNLLVARIARISSVMTPNGEFVSRKALIQKITNDGILNATDKLREWFKLYPNDYYYIKKPKKNRRIQGVIQVNDSNSSTQNELEHAQNFEKVQT